MKRSKLSSVLFITLVFLLFYAPQVHAQEGFPPEDPYPYTQVGLTSFEAHVAGVFFWAIVVAVLVVIGWIYLYLTRRKP